MEDFKVKLKQDYDFSKLQDMREEFDTFLTNLEIQQKRIKVESNCMNNFVKSEIESLVANQKDIHQLKKDVEDTVSKINWTRVDLNRDDLKDFKSVLDKIHQE